MIHLSTKKIFTLLIAGLLALSFAPIHSQASGSIVVGIHDDMVNLDPHNFRHRATETILRNIFDGFVTRGPDMQPVPELAQSLEQIEPLVWEITLRQGVKFHDGSDFTAEDAAYSINRYVQEGAMAGQTSPRRDLLGPVTHAEVAGEYTILVHMDRPYSVFQPDLVHHMVVPSSVGDGSVEHPVGTGPFKFVEWERGSHVILERFDDYYGGAPDLGRTGPAPADQVVFRIIPETATRLAALMAGEIDIMTEVPVHLMDDIQADPNLELRPVEGTRSFFIELNLRQPPFDDVRVRKAMNYALDVQLIIDELLEGLAVPLSTILSPLSFGHNDELEPYGYDPERARELLAEAGYPDGFTITLATEDKRRDIAEAYAFMLRGVGIEAQVRVMPDWATMTDAMARDEYEAMLTDWGASTMDPSGIFIPKLRTDDRGNFGGYSNPAVDVLIDFAESTRNTEARAEAYRHAQTLVFEDAAMVFEYLPQELYAHRAGLQGWDPIPDSRVNLHTADSP